MKLKQYSVQPWVGSSFDAFLPQPPKRGAGYRNPGWEVGIMEFWKKQEGARRTAQGARRTQRNGNKRLEKWKENKKTEYGRE
jgi:hypothetical protein